MSTVAGVLRRLLIPSSICGFGVTVVYAKKKEEPPPPVDCDPNRKLVRASDLPLYVEEKACEDCTPKKEETAPSLLVDTIKCAREELWLFLEQGRIASKQISQYYSEVREEADSALAFLREESNVAPRVGAIAIGGLTGLVLSLRKGLFKRLLYTTAGATTMAALCYPNEAKEYTEEGIKQGKKYILITYHFLNGVSRDLTGYQLPPLPGGHLVISDGHHHLDSTEVPPSAHLLPPTANATHIPMPHEERSEEMKKHQDQSHQENRDKTT